MPVVTRSQNDNSNVLTEQIFKLNLKYLTEKCSVSGVENKITNIINFFKYVNENISNFIEKNPYWMKFIGMIYKKSLQIIHEIQAGMCVNCDKKLVKKFLQECNKTKNMASNIIKNDSYIILDDIEYDSFVDEQRETSRPRRNIARVDYTGMDTIEPECEFDEITDIWADLTIQEDPDYEFEEDEDNEEEDDEDDEDDEEEDEEVYNFAKIHPELTTKEKYEIKQHLTQLVQHNRVKRNVPRVNYTGMDMNEEDIGQIHVNKRWFEDGKVKYIWKSYSLSQANEIEDEDYVDDE
jgi:hypothetical protein